MTTYLTDAELAQMRADIQGLMADSCTIRAAAVGVDSLGSGPISYTDTANVPCRLAPITIRNQSTEGEQFHVNSGWVLTLRHDQVVNSGDKVVLGGDSFTVLSVEDDHTWRTCRRAYLRRGD